MKTFAAFFLSPCFAAKVYNAVFTLLETVSAASETIYH